MNIKKLVADSIGLKINVNFEELINIVQEEGRGDYCIPCFGLAKVLKKSPIIIAEELKASINNKELYDKVEVVNGYLNFYLSKSYIIRNVLYEAINNKNFYKDEEYAGKTMCIYFAKLTEL